MKQGKISIQDFEDYSVKIQVAISGQASLWMIVKPAEDFVFYTVENRKTGFFGDFVSFAEAISCFNSELEFNLELKQAQ